jgi:starch-binding outer membrane protein, SusD/RagB family
MKKLILKTGLIMGIVSISMSSCKDALDLQPTNDKTSEVVYKDLTGYQQSLAKVYGSFALTGNSGGAGNPDIVGLDEGSNADYLRTFWKAQELSTDEAVIGWGDVGLQDFHNMNWTPDNPFLRGQYFRSIYQITLVNEFIRESTDAKIAERGITGNDATLIKSYVPEVKFLRAYQYWSLMDLFGNPPFTTEDNAIGGDYPKQIGRTELFNYIEAQLKEIEVQLPADRTTAYYGRATKSAAQALLARLYLNAITYTGTARNSEAVTYAKKVIDAGYTLNSNYRFLGLNDNNTSPESIFTINYDGQKTQLYGGTTFLSHAAVGGSMSAATYGLDNAWSGIRTTKNLVNMFPDGATSADKRANFYTNGQNLEIASLTTFTDGYAVPKFQNVTSTGVKGSNQTFPDADFPLFRLAEMYLTYAEATLRGGSGDNALALSYINSLRVRAYGSTAGNLSSISLDIILDERARELYWEGHRRTDLIRYGKFTEATYLWPWKGGIKDGRGVDSYRKLYPIPSADISANTNLVQNTGY